MVRNIIKIELIESLMQGFRFAGGYVVALPIFGYHYLMDRELNYQESLTTLSMLGFASLLIFNQMYAALSLLSKFYAILKRIGELLEMDEFDSEYLKVMDENEHSDFNYDTKDFNFNPEDPQLIVIAGMIGSGKSTLLSCLISKIIKTSKQENNQLRLAYVEQEPFIISGTLKDNILFGLEYDEERMNKVIEVCCLEHDLEIFNKGLDTEIGERGINVSGGQKARISLARACYSDADVILLDDPLSAVDPDVAEKIFKYCIGGFLKNKHVVLVTHQIQFLKEVQTIVILDQFKIKMKGNFSELKKQGLDFDVILSSFQNKETNTKDIFDQKEESKNNEIFCKILKMCSSHAILKK